MGRHKPGKPRRERPGRLVTREPGTPLEGWPKSHVDAELTGDEAEECVRVTIHGVEHLLHATTARELSNMLLSTLDAYNQGVRTAMEDPAMRALLEGQVPGKRGASGKGPSLDDLIV